MQEIYKTPKLVSTTAKGLSKFWQGKVLYDGNYYYTSSEYYQTLKDGSSSISQESVPTLVKGKNIGKKNETNPKDQAISEVNSDYMKKRDKGYTLEGETVQSLPLPMLAHEYKKRKHTLPGTVYLQPKLDGCVSGETLIKTKEFGLKSIKWIVENKVKCKIKSMDKNGKLEYREILSWFLNKEDGNNCQWYEIEIESGEKLKLTGNHPVYLPDFNCYRRVDELIGNENLMVV